MLLERSPHGSPNIRRQPPEIFDGFGGEDDGEGHSGQIIARLVGFVKTRAQDLRFEDRRFAEAVCRTVIADGVIERISIKARLRAIQPDGSHREIGGFWRRKRIPTWRATVRFCTTSLPVVLKYRIKPPAVYAGLAAGRRAAAVNASLPILGHPLNDSFGRVQTGTLCQPRPCAFMRQMGRTWGPAWTT